MGCSRRAEPGLEGVARRGCNGPRIFFGASLEVTEDVRGRAVVGSASLVLLAQAPRVLPVALGERRPSNGE